MKVTPNSAKGLKSLSAFEPINKESLSFINGGSSSTDEEESKKYDSEKMDCRKHDKFPPARRDTVISSEPKS